MLNELKDSRFMKTTINDVLRMLNFWFGPEYFTILAFYVTWPDLHG